MKTCVKCLGNMPFSSFGTRTRNSDGKRERCKSCEKIDREKYLSTPEGEAARLVASKKWYAKNRDYSLDRVRVWATQNKEHLFNYRRKSLLKKTYGLSIEEYTAMELSQNKRCKICGSEKPGRGYKHFFIDHCHATSKIRGLLCLHCNMAIGQLKDSPILLRRAAEYIEHFGEVA